jgi:hypothetical protein
MLCLRFEFVLEIVYEQGLAFLDVVLHLGDVLEGVVDDPELRVGQLADFEAAAVDQGDVPPGEAHEEKEQLAQLVQLGELLFLCFHSFQAVETAEVLFNFVELGEGVCLRFSFYLF